jgi:hypothetical protein
MLITLVTTILNIDSDFEVTYNSLRPVLSDGLRWHIWQNSTERTDVLNIDKGCLLFHGRDTGIYDAMNSVLKTVPDGFFFHAGAGDRINSEVAAKLCDLVKGAPSNRVYSYPVYLERHRHNFIPNLKLMDQYMSCAHPGVVMHKELLNTLGGYSMSYRVSADYDLVCRAINSKGVEFVLDRGDPLVYYKGDGNSDKRYVEAALENALIQYRNFGTSSDKLFRNLVERLGLIKAI